MRRVYCAYCAYAASMRYEEPNGLAYLLVILLRQLTRKSTILCKMPRCAHAEGGQVEPVLGNLILTVFSYLELAVVHASQAKTASALC